jgi:hypothetical protein
VRNKEKPLIESGQQWPFQKVDIMSRTIKFSEEEWEVVTELLEQERGNLPPEIRHTDSPTVHDDLQKRLATVNALAEKMKSAPVRAAAAPSTIR